MGELERLATRLRAELERLRGDPPRSVRTDDLQPNEITRTEDDMNTGDMKVGDVVRLNSGGPLMTIEGSVTRGCPVKCVWLNNNGEVMRSAFQSKTLKIEGDAK